MGEEVVDILLADDSAADIELVSKALKRENERWNIATVSDGMEAMAFVFGPDDNPKSKLLRRPRLIVLDLKMPRMNGFQVLQRLKSDPRTRDIPIVVLTVSPEQKDMTECVRLGANDYKVKPVTYDYYRQMVQDIANRWLEDRPASV